MSNKWIEARLSSVKRNTDSWAQLATSLQDTFDSIIEPTLARFTSMRSLFTASDEDLELVEDDLGAFFHVERSLKGKDKAMAILAKQDDINYKSTLKPMQDQFNREFKGLKVEWSPLYAHSDLVTNPYGTPLALLTEAQIVAAGQTLDDYFLTSRGIVRLNAIDISLLGYTITEFSSVLKEIIKDLKPVHIVYDGEEVYLLYALSEIPSIVDVSIREIVREFPSTDNTSTYAGTRHLARAFPHALSVWDNEEYFRLDDLPADIYPMDTPLNEYGETYT
jgi:hypothetical protein